MDLQDFRRTYLQQGLDEQHTDASPFEQLRQWLREALQASPGEWFECNAMTLATAMPGGGVAARIVLLKELSDDGLTFFTSYLSDKAAQMEANPQVCCVFYWGHLERQVRVEGSVTKTSAEESDAYFARRPRGSQLGARASQQSKPIASRRVLEGALAAEEAAYEGREVQRPEAWGGYRIEPHRFEFWQGRPDRLHDRVVYTRSGTAWARSRLSP